MLAPLLALVLLAPGGSCERVWASIEQGKDFKQDVLGNLLRGDAAKVAVLRGHFLEGCAKLPAAEQDCGVKHPGRTMTRSCPSLGTAFHEAATAPDVAGVEVARLRDEGLAREAVANLRKLGQAARALRLQSGPRADFQFPASVEATPAASCCATAAKVCAPSAGDWASPTWTALGFAPTDPLHFQYSFTSAGQGREAHFLLRAVGDPDCTGQPQTWELGGKSEGGKFVVGDAEKK